MEVDFCPTHWICIGLELYWSIMAKVINFPDGKEIVKKDSDTVDIIHKLGDELSLVFEKDKVILSYF